MSCNHNVSCDILKPHWWITIGIFQCRCLLIDQGQTASGKISGLDQFLTCNIGLGSGLALISKDWLSWITHVFSLVLVTLAVSKIALELEKGMNVPLKPWMIMRSVVGKKVTEDLHPFLFVLRVLSISCSISIRRNFSMRGLTVILCQIQLEQIRTQNKCVNDNPCVYELTQLWIQMQFQM